MNIEKKIFLVKKDVVCLSCGNQGAMQSYGSHYPTGMGEDVSPHYEKYKNKPFLRRTETLGGALPYECLKCAEKGFIDSDFGGFEGYKQQFQTLA